MVDHTSATIPRPKNWQDFELCCQILFECLLKDPHTQRNGRSGQAQHGVDIFGRRGSVSDHWVGVQCKGKNAWPPSRLTEAELEDEVIKAQKFEPKLREFILVTTAPNDAEIQCVARQFTEENEKSGINFSVNVYGWEELESRISEHPRALRAFHPDATPFTDEIIARFDNIERSQTLIFERFGEGASFDNAVDVSVQVSTISDNADPNDDLLYKTIHREIDGYRDLLNRGKPKTALELLNALKERVWEHATPRVQFRLLTNIGAAKLRMSDEEGAAVDFLAAKNFDPDNKIALANTVLALLLQGETSKAVDAARAALAQDDSNDAAASYLIQAHISDSSIEEPETLVPSNLHKSETVKVAILTFLRQRGMREWRAFAKEAVSAFPKSRELRRAAAEAVLDTLHDAGGFLQGERNLEDLDMAVLHQAISTLEELWTEQKNSEVVSLDPSLPYNLSQAYRASGDISAASKLCEETLKLCPERTYVLKLAATLRLQQNDFENALSLLSSKAEDAELTLMAAEIRLHTQPEKVSEILADIQQIDADEKHQFMKGWLEVECYLQIPDCANALGHAKTLLESNPLSVEAFCNLARAQSLCGDPDADKTLTDAQNHLNKNSTFFERLLLAEILQDNFRHDDAATVLDDWVDCSRDSPALQLLLMALISGDQRHRAHEIIRNLPDDVADKRFYSHARAVVHLNRGDLKAAEEAFETYLANWNDDLSMHLHWIDVKLRRDGSKEIAAFLTSRVEDLQGTPTDRIRLATFLKHFGFNERALKLAYETLIHNRKIPEVNLFFVGLFMPPNSEESPFLDCNIVAVDTVFICETSVGETETYLIEPDEALRQRQESISPSHIAAQAALGKTVGDHFSIKKTGETGDDLRITSVRHKYIFELQEIMERFERRFPDVSGLERIIYDENSDQPLAPALNRVKARHDAIQGILAQYEKTMIPLEVVARSTGSSVFETWGGLISLGKRFKVCGGTHQERNKATEAITRNKGKGCVTDAITLHIIRRLNLSEVLKEVCGPINVTESTVDAFRNNREQIAFYRGRPYMTICWRDGDFYRDEVTPEKIEEAVADADSEIEWVSENCSIIPAEGTNDLPADLRGLSREIGGHFFDTVLAVEGRRLVLVSEDHAYRQLATQAGHFDVTWLQPVIMIARSKGIISEADYARVVADMIRMGWFFVTIDSKLLFQVGARWEERNNDEFAVVSSVLGGPDADINSHIKVAASYLNAIWRTPNPGWQRAGQTGKILEALTRGRATDWQEILKSLLQTLGRENLGFREYVRSWLTGHFLAFEGHSTSKGE